MRRKPGALVPFELAICEAAAVLRQRGTTAFYGYQLAKELKHSRDTRLLTAYGTLYRALARLEDMGLLKARWEDPRDANAEGRPARRLYELTGAGDAALETARVARRRPARATRKKPSPA